MKRMYVWMRAFLLCLSAILPCAMAESDTERVEIDKATYVILEDGTAEMVWYYDEYVRKIEIPREISYQGQKIPVSRLAGGYTPNAVEVTIPNSVTYIDGEFFNGWDKLKTIYIKRDHEVFSLINGVLFERDSRKLVCYPAGLSAREYVIPQGVEVIGEHAFYLDADTPLSEIVISEGVTTIEEWAFSGPFEHIALPKSLRVLKRGALRRCENLTSIIVPAGVTEIDEWAFPYDCILYVYPDSYAAQWAEERWYPYYYYLPEFPEGMEWVREDGGAPLITTDTSWLTD